MGARWVGIAAATALVALAACRPPPPPPLPGPMTLGWSAPGVTGPVAADQTETPNLVWAVNTAAGVLDGLNAATGAVVAQHSVSLLGSQHFPTPEVVPGWVLVESGQQVAAFSTPAVATPTSWTSAALDGVIQARPLVVGSVVVVATEHDSLYGLNLSNGTTAWGPVSIGTPESLGHIRTFPFLGGCGNIDPLGITSNPVLDNGSVYAVGEVATGTGAGVNPPVHKLAGVNPATGAFTLSPVQIDPAGMYTAAQQQRAGLGVSNNHVFVGFGGFTGDCGNYHGWVVSVAESGGSVTGSFEATAVSKAGGVWATGGLAVDSAGNVYAATGNGQGSPSTGTDYSDGVVRVPGTLSGAQTAPADYFQPAEWRSDNAVDADLGSAAPVLLPNGTQLFIIGKQHNAFLLSTGALGGADHLTPLVRLNSACPGEVLGQNAVIASSAYIACSNGMQQVVIS